MPASRIQRGERGYSMAFYAVMLSFVVLPLLSLSIDLTRAFYVRTHLQAATDAACEAAAQTLDVPAFNSSGVETIDGAKARVNAAREFSATVIDQGIVKYMPSLGSVAISGKQAACNGTASVQTIFQITPPLNVRVSSTSEMRVGRH